MITHVSLATLWVRDLDDALSFYTETLGFELREDVRLTEDFRWLTIGHPSQPELNLHLTRPRDLSSDDLAQAIERAQAEGGFPAVGLSVDDCRTTFEELSAKGVAFVQEPSERPYGVEAILRDTSGNWLVMVEHRAFDPDAMTIDDLG